MKTKTLKDLELGIGEHEEIRAEAVNDIKFFREKGFNYNVSELVDAFCSKEETKAVIEYIKWKNNLTEEDLK